MRFKNLLAGSGLATVLMCAGTAANAIPINLGGYSGPIIIKFTDFEAFTGAFGPGVDNFGIFEITSIENSSAVPIYNAPLGTPTASDPLIVGVFSQIHVNTVTGNAPNIHTFNTGGVFSLYDDTTTNFATIAAQGLSGYANAVPPCAVDTQCYHDITDQGFDNILNLMLVPGASSAALTSTLYGTISVATPLTGSAQGYGDFTGGSDIGQFKPGTFTTAANTLADVFFQDGFCTVGQSGCVGSGGNWPIISQDPIQTSTIPEPASLGLLGTMLLGLGALRWRRKRG